MLLMAPAPCAEQTAHRPPADPDCIEKISPGSNAKYSKIYRSFPLTEKNAAIERALIVIHGAGRDAHNYFASAVAGALIAGALRNSVILAPRFASTNGSGCRDTLGADEISCR